MHAAGGRAVDGKSAPARKEAELNSTAYAYFKFLTEILAAAILIVYPLPRRKMFVLRAVCCLAGCYVLSRIWNYEMSRFFFLSVLRYTLLYTCVILSVWICFDLRPSAAVFCGVSAYCMQFTVIKIYGFIEYILLPRIPFWGIVLVYISVLLIGYALFLWLYVRRLRKKLQYRPERTDLLLCCVAIVFVMIVVGMVISHFVGELNIWAQAVMTVYGVLCAVFILCLQSSAFRKGAMRLEMQQMEQLWAQERRQMEISKANIELINVKCHDMKNMLENYRGGIPSEGMEELKSLISVYDMSVKTGNAALDLVIAEKSLYMRQNKICFTCIADGAAIGFMTQSDVYSLFGNALANAAEAAAKVQNESERAVSLMIRRAMGVVSVHLENCFDGEIRYENGRPITSKGEERGYHGFGTRSIELITEKYGGSLSARAEGQIYKLDIAFIEECGGEEYAENFHH